jgi:hypothetical protein
MTSQEKAAAWIAEVGKTQAVIECKKAIEKLEKQMDTMGYTVNDLAYLREYQTILKLIQNTTT